VVLRRGVLRRSLAAASAAGERAGDGIVTITYEAPPTPSGPTTPTAATAVVAVVRLTG